MKIYYEESDLVSFGEYLTSSKRTERITASYREGDNIPLTERLAQVYHADLENWKEEQKVNHDLSNSN